LRSPPTCTRKLPLNTGAINIGNKGLSMMRIVFFSSAAAAQRLTPGTPEKWFATIRAGWHAFFGMLRRASGLLAGLLTLAAGALVVALLA
jgi:uncharacterized protein YhjY with autotransporter beta-barrel domain